MLWAQERVSETGGPGGYGWAVGEEPWDPGWIVTREVRRRAVGAGGHGSAGCGEQAAQPIPQLRPAVCMGHPDKARPLRLKVSILVPGTVM